MDSACTFCLLTWKNTKKETVKRNSTLFPACALLIMRSLVQLLSLQMLLLMFKKCSWVPPSFCNFTLAFICVFALSPFVFSLHLPFIFSFSLFYYASTNTRKQNFFFPKNQSTLWSLPHMDLFLSGGLLVQVNICSLVVLWINSNNSDRVSLRWQLNYFHART